MKKKIILKGPLLTRSGYGEQARFALRALRSREDIYDIYIQPITWGQNSWISEADDERKWVDDTIERTIHYIQAGGTFDESLQVTIPTEWEDMASVNIGYTAGIETTKVAWPWIEAGNKIDKIVVVSEHAADTYKDTSYSGTDTRTNQPVHLALSTDITAVGYPTKEYKKVDVDLDLDTEFNFINVTQWSIRKNLEHTIRWFVEEFHDDNVGLVIKTNLSKNCLMDREIVADRMHALIRDFPDRKCKLYLIHGEMTDQEIHALYSHPKIDAMVSFAHGEGFGLPLFEAAYSGLPIVTIGWSGHMDFLVDQKGERRFYDVAYDLANIQKEAVWDNVLIPESMWAFARPHDAKKQMRQCYEDLTDPKKSKKILKNTKKYAKELHERFTPENQYKQFLNAMGTTSIVDEVATEEIPQVTLVTSVFNASEHIEQLMEDVTRQTIFQDKCEWIILDVNSPEDDFEEKVINKYAEKFPNIKYQRLEEDPGVYGVWNRAIEMSQGEFITNINCDDRRAPYGLEHQAKMLVHNPDVDLVYNDSYISRQPNVAWEDISPELERYNFENFSKEAMLRGNLPHNNPMWRRSLHDNHGMFDDKYKSAGDWEFWLRCTFAGAKFKKYNNILGVYYFNPEGISTNDENTAWKQEEEKEVFKKYFAKLQQETQPGAK